MQETNTGLSSVLLNLRFLQDTHSTYKVTLCFFWGGGNVCNPTPALPNNLIAFISVFNQLDAENLFHNKFYFMPLHVSSTCVHLQEVKIALHSLWYHHIYRCDDTRGSTSLYMLLHVSSTMCSSSGGQNYITQPLVSSHL